MNLETGACNTWCPGCGNFAILASFKKVVEELVKEGRRHEDIVIASGIGCHAKIVDYVNVNSFYSIHGRVPPTISGMKVANPNLTVVGFAGDGDGYGEGVAHLVFAAKRNIDITMIIHNNRIYGLTTGQFSPTTPQGQKTKSTPYGNPEYPLNPIKLMLGAGATFVARTSSFELEHMRQMMKEAVNHRGFAIVDVVEPCLSFFNAGDYIKANTYKMNHDPSDLKKAWEKACEWNYTTEGKIHLGIFYREEKPTFGELLLKGKNLRKS
ncbi:MAG: 2-oxoacid:ferredoxin oxidoreductase subunit beta [archaeon]|nr:MAG: 2-oxoacid:ferredoxin oxidoreductase subunit beta [archaeon]